MRVVRITSILLVCLACAAPVLAGKGKGKGKDKAETSPTLSHATYRVRSGPATIILGSGLALANRDQPFFPLQIAIGVNIKSPRLIITRASFTLTDGEGTIHRLAPYAEVVEAGRILYNTAAERLAPLQKGNTFLDHHLASSAFFPQSGAKTRDEFVQLNRRTYFQDTIYFPFKNVNECDS